VIRKKRKVKKASKAHQDLMYSLLVFIKYHICGLLWVRSRRCYLRYCYHSIFILHLMIKIEW